MLDCSNSTVFALCSESVLTVSAVSPPSLHRKGRRKSRLAPVVLLRQHRTTPCAHQLLCYCSALGRHPAPRTRHCAAKRVRLHGPSPRPLQAGVVLSSETHQRMSGRQGQGQAELRRRSQRCSPQTALLPLWEPFLPTTGARLGRLAGRTC
jgi:hypothetical protein